MLFPTLKTYCQQLTTTFDQIPTERKKALKKLSNYVFKKYQEGFTPQIIVICTHNSRRSHLGQMWLAIGADYYDLPDLSTFSGGTEATAMHENIVEVLQKAGVQVQADDTNVANPIYLIKWKAEQDPYPAFSKKYEDTPNPTRQFSAVMVCSEADAGCPFVVGTDFRIALPFNDPKAFDATAEVLQKYEESSQEIGREMLFMLKETKELLP